MLKTTNQFLFVQFFFKVLERIVYDPLYKYFMKNDILYEYQFAFLTNNSSEHAILQFTRNIA